MQARTTLETHEHETVAGSDGSPFGAGTLRRRWRRAAVFLVFCATLAAPLLGAGGSAEAEVLVSNLGSATSTGVRLGTDSTGQDAVQMFTTGTNAGGYTLTSIDLDIYVAARFENHPTVALHSVTVAGTAVTLGTAVATLTASLPLVVREFDTYTAPADTSLDPSTTYGFFVEGGSDGIHWGVTSTGDEDATPATGWSIGDQAATRAHDSTGVFTLGSDGPAHIRVNGTAKTGTNNAPTVENMIPDQSVTVDTSFSYAFPDTTFADADGDTLTYGATKADGTTLPTWLTFTAGTRTFSGTPQRTDIATVSVKVTASDSNGGSVSDTFDIEVVDITPPTLVSAIASQSALGISWISFTFSEDMQSSNPPPASAFTVTVDGSPATVSDVNLLALFPSLTGIAVSPVIRPRQAVVVTYTDPTSGDDTNAIQDTAGNDAATFTTGLNGVPAVTNESNANNNPTATAIPDQSATVGTAFSYAFPDTTFTDADGDTLTYMATKADGTALPTWLSFAAGTRTFSGTPQAADIATVSVKVTASDGYGGSVSDEFDITVSAAANTLATGAPTITGTAQVGETLTAVTTAIMDAEGLTGVSYTYQWIRVAGGAETDISSAMASTYTLVTADQGKTIKVKVSFNDDANNAETLTSDAYPSSGTVLAAPNTAPTSADDSVETPEDTDYVFFIDDFPFMDQDADDNSYISVKIETLPAPGKGTLALAGTVILSANLPKTVPRADIHNGRLKYSPPENENSGGAGFTSFTFKVNDGEEDSSLAYTMTLEIGNVNDPATGKPGITGTAQVGQTLTATVGTIADVDGLPAPFFSNASTTVQWVRVDGGVDTDIESATAGTYTLATADEGKKIKVKVSFRDRQADARTSEGPLTSDAYPSSGTVLADNTAPTSADKTVTTNEDTDYTFSSADFAFTDTDPGNTLSSVKIETLPASGKGTLTLSGTAITGTLPRTVLAAQLGNLKYAPPANENGAGYASFTFKVNDGTVDSTTANTVTVNVTAVNDAATGKPGIAGTARVGQALMATVGTIADPDGLPDPFLTDSNTTFRWVRVTSGTDADISGATTDTYTLVTADNGKTIKVKVSFRDAGGGSVGPLTSDAYPSGATVLPALTTNTAPTSADKTVTTNEDTDYGFTATDFPFTDTDPVDSLTSVKIVTLPAPGKGTLTLSGTAIASGELPKTVTAAEFVNLKYSPPANENGTGYASFTFKVNDGMDDSVAANTVTINVTAVNDPATGKPVITGTARVDQTLTATAAAIADGGRVEYLLLPVDPGVGQRQRHFGRDGQHLHAGRRRRGQHGQGEGLVQ